MLKIIDIKLSMYYIVASKDNLSPMKGPMMPYREKVGWLSLAAMAVAFIPYFALTAAAKQSSPMPNLHQLWLFLFAVIVQVVVLGIGHAVFFLGTPRDAKMPPDERDLTIQRQSMSAAYYVLIAGTIMVGCVLPFTSTGWKLVNGAIFTIVAAEIVHYGVVVFSYRRQA